MAELFHILIAVFVTVLVCGLIAILSRARGTPFLELDMDVLPKIQDSLPMLAGLTESTVYDGNRGTIFQNGAVFPAMMADIAAATHSIHLETFVWCEGVLETQFVEALTERARAGVKVRVLRDALGGSRASSAALERLTADGVKISGYCEPKWWNWGRFNNRTHRKLLIVDGRIGYTFGHGVSDQWLGDGEDPEHWRDTVCRP